MQASLQLLRMMKKCDILVNIYQTLLTWWEILFVATIYKVSNYELQLLAASFSFRFLQNYDGKTFIHFEIHFPFIKFFIGFTVVLLFLIKNGKMLNFENKKRNMIISGYLNCPLKFVRCLPVFLCLNQ